MGWWFFKKEAPEETPVLQLNIYRNEDGTFTHGVVKDEKLFEELERHYKESPVQFDSQMDEKTKLAVFLNDYLMKVMNYEQLIRNYLSSVGEPYFKVSIQRTRVEEVSVESDYNIHFIYNLDKVYAKNQATFDPLAEDHAKIAVYLFDIISQIAKQYLPEEDADYHLDDPMMNIPALAVRGGKEVKTVVDLANRNPEQTETIVDVRQ